MSSTARVRTHRVTDRRGRRRTPVRTYLAGAVGLLLLFALLPSGGFADGSRDQYQFASDPACNAAGSCRASIEWRTDTYGPAGSKIFRRSLFSVYLTAGEILETGSSAVGVGQGDTWVWNPGDITNDQTPNLPGIGGAPGAPAFRCSDQRTTSSLATQGQITSRAQEKAGPQSADGSGNTAGYVPCTFVAPTAGVYKVAFFGPSGPTASGNGAPTADVAMTDPKNFGTQQGSSVSAWDITVRDAPASTADLTGRVFTYALAAFTGGNGKPLNTTFYATTLDGYVYQANTNGLDPNGFLLYGNEQGFLDPEGLPLYHDVLGGDGQLSTVQGGVALAGPEYPLSFTPLSTDTLNAIGVTTTPVPPVLTNLSFNGAPSGQRVYVSQGGRFGFDTNEHGTYEIVVSRDGVDFDPGAPNNRALRGIVDAGSHSVVWDGKDNAGRDFPPGSNYAVHSRMQAGVYHFPLIDAENSMRGGPSFTLTNPPGGACRFGGSCSTAFYDDRGYHTSLADVGTVGATLCGQNAPAINHSNGDTGYDSTSAQRAYGASPGTNTNASCTGSFGDAKGLDTWTYFPSNEDQATFDIDPIPPTPLANPDSGTAVSGTPTTIAAGDPDGLLQNDSGTNITVTGHTTPGHGTVTTTPGGGWTYTPDPTYSGPDSFGYTVTDDAGQTSSSTVSVTVTPQAVADSGTVGADQTLTVTASPTTGVLANDQGSGLSVTGHTSPAHGTLTIGADGGYTYTPTPGYSGNDSFDYTVTDSSNQSSTATVSLAVAPRAVADAGTTAVNTTLSVAGPGVLANDHGSGLGVTAATTPAHGSLVWRADGSYDYTPNPDFSGRDSFTYTASDGVRSDSATVDITVTPQAVADDASTTVDTDLVVPARGVLANDHGTGLTVTGHTNPSHGTLTLNADGSYTYRPDAGYTGPDSFTYIASDGTTPTSAVNVNLHVLPTTAGDVYNATAETRLYVAASGVLANDAGTGLAVTGHTNPTHGTLTMSSGDGSFSYLPDPGFSGTDSFTYTATDSSGQSSGPRTVQLVVAPKAVADLDTTTAGTDRVVAGPGVLANDRGTGLHVTANGQPTHGTVTVNADGGYTYHPAAGYSGPDSFTYTVTDASSQSVTQTVSMVVTPRGVTDDYSTPFQTTKVVPVGTGVLSNDLGTSLTVVSHTNPAHGTLTLDPNGSFSYVPATGYSGSDSFTYVARDASNQDTPTVLVTLSVGLVAADDQYSTPADTTLGVATGSGLLANDRGTGLTVTSHGQPTHGSVTVAADGALSFVPEANWSGTDSFGYTVTDSSGATATATATLSVTPRALDDVATTRVGTALQVAAGPGVLGNDRGSGLSVTAHVDPAHGTLTIAGDGGYTYTPVADYSGPDSFTYTATDAAGGTSTATVRITVTPSTTDDAVTTTVDTPVRISSVANDHGSGLRVTSVTQPAHGRAAVVDGGVRFTPDRGWSGVTSCTYTAVDASGQTVTGVETIRVTPLALPERARTGVDTPITLDSVRNDRGSRLTISSVQQPTSGGVVAVRDGRIVFRPARGFTGTVTFDYVVTDAAGQTATATDTVVVSPMGDADPDTTTTPEDHPVTIDPAANDPGHDTYTTSTLQLRDPRTGVVGTTVTIPGQGTYSVDPRTGKVTFTPVKGFQGEADPVTYQVADGAGVLHVSTIRVTVTPQKKAGTTPTGPTSGGLPGTGSPMGWQVPGAGLLLLLAGLVLLRHRRREPAPVRVEGGSRRRLPGTHRRR